MTARRFAQVDVFSDVPIGGNPVAVVLDGQELSDAEMLKFAQWTNLSETTFVLPPNDPAADYAVRIFTPRTELPFAGHPTLGTCHAWLESGGVPRSASEAVQECGAGLVRVRLGRQLAFAAPPTIRSGAVDPVDLERVLARLGLRDDDVVAHNWVDNGPGWIGLLLRDSEAVLSVDPDPLDDLYVGIIGPTPPGSEESFEVRAFFPSGGGTAEDPVTGSLNASLAQWFVRDGIAAPPYRTRQGTAIGRSGVVSIDRSPTGEIWVGGATRTRITGTVDLSG
jgi:PhzF family phenazine biosynthesis protein